MMILVAMSIVVMRPSEVVVTAVPLVALILTPIYAIPKESRRTWRAQWRDLVALVLSLDPTRMPEVSR